MTLSLATLSPLQSLRRRWHPVFALLQRAFHRNRIPSPSSAQKSQQPFNQWHLRVTRSKSGFTLVELSVTIAVILVLIGIASLGIQPYLAYRDGRAAGEMLRSVKAAQLMYLSDNPTTKVTNLNQGLLLPYMPNGTWPTLPSYNGTVPTINCTAVSASDVASPPIRPDPQPMAYGTWDSIEPSFASFSPRRWMVTH